jgi:peptidoglycan hydrolase-like protein with peptidoglycan-binding domain
MAKDSMVKASTPEPLSRSKTSNWVARAGGLPAYIQHIARDLMEKRGKSESQAVQMAIGIVRNWAAGKGNVDANTRAAAAKAVAQWEALKARNKAAKITETPVEQLPAADRAIAETFEPPAFLFVELEPDEIGDLKVLEAAAKPPALSNAKRRPGESLASWGRRLKAGDKANADAAAAKTRSGGSQDFASKHPRGRGGEWTFRHGARGAEVRTIQRHVGAKTDGQYGDLTAAAVRRYQRKHGLKVDGVVGRQTVAAMRGKANAQSVKPGAMSARDRAFLSHRH